MRGAVSGPAAPVGNTRAAGLTLVRRSFLEVRGRKEKAKELRPGMGTRLEMEEAE